MPVNTVSIDLGTVLSQGLSITTAGNSAVSAYGPRIGRDVAVVALMVPRNLQASSSTETTFAATGAAVGDPVFVGPPSALSADLDWAAYVSSAGNVTLRLLNPSASTITQTAQTWSFDIARRSFVTRI